MHPEKYSITWYSYSDHLKSMIKGMMMNEDLSDVTLVTEDNKQIKAHINILSTCSPVLKDLIKKKQTNSNPIINLRDIQYSEMESIMQFIYLGEATFYGERMDEFLAVAKSLEIEALCNAVTEIYDELSDKPSPETKSEPIVISKAIIKHAPQVKKESISDRKFECKPCHKVYHSKKGLYFHNITISHSMSTKYGCNQCGYQATQQNNLTKHIQYMHKGVKHACDQCDYQFTEKACLRKHIQSKHEGVRYACD